ncbi:uncharacterized protein LOC118506105 [Anopheles stephensi]|uniref:uncharacterized protein LOC118506105 n=1 Tax=Anopheles stephensi TaxID=30069 RepID=UPI0016589816|nr:uncharacterized protein LOC118506105 [Anopheles stephensi]
MSFLVRCGCPNAVPESRNRFTCDAGGFFLLNLSSRSIVYFQIGTPEGLLGRPKFATVSGCLRSWKNSPSRWPFVRFWSSVKENTPKNGVPGDAYVMAEGYVLGRRGTEKCLELRHAHGNASAIAPVRLSLVVVDILKASPSLKIFLAMHREYRRLQRAT